MGGWEGEENEDGGWGVGGGEMGLSGEERTSQQNPASKLTPPLMRSTKFRRKKPIMPHIRSSSMVRTGSGCYVEAGFLERGEKMGGGGGEKKNRETERE